MRPKLLDVNQVAEYLNVSNGSVSMMVYRRQIPFIKIGGRLRFDPAEIDAWLDAQRVKVAG